MKREIQVSASILCADFSKLGDEIKRCEDAGVDMIHLDVMDGHFVPNISIGQVILDAIRPLTKLPIESHLMIENPGMYIDDFIDKGSDIISFQVECYGTLKPECDGLGKYPKEVDSVNIGAARKDIQRIHDKGKKAFAVVSPGTPLCFNELLNDVDGVLVMSVNPGFAKQKFMPVALSKIEQLRKDFDGDISVDGGVNADTAPQAVKAGANILATASYFFGSEDQKKTVMSLKGLKE